MSGPEGRDLPEGNRPEGAEDASPGNAEDLRAPLVVLAIIGACFLLGLVLLAVTMMAG